METGEFRRRQHKVSNAETLRASQQTFQQTTAGVPTSHHSSRNASFPSVSSHQSTPSPTTRNHHLTSSRPSLSSQLPPTEYNRSADVTTSDAFRPFRMTRQDMPEDLFLSGSSNEDVPLILERFLTRVKLNGTENVPRDVLERRAIKYLPLLCRDSAASSLIQLQAGTLEWRTEQLAVLRDAGNDVSIVPPETWNDYVNAFTNLFAPPNLIGQLARSLMALKYDEQKEVTVQAVDNFALEYTSAYSRFHAEAKRACPPNQDPLRFAWDKFMTAHFESPLPPSVRLDMMREDPTSSFQMSRMRAKKHAANNSGSVLHVSALSMPAPDSTVTTAASAPQSDRHFRRLSAEVTKLREQVKRGPPPTVSGNSASPSYAAFAATPQRPATFAHHTASSVSTSHTNNGGPNSDGPRANKRMKRQA